MLFSVCLVLSFLLNVLYFPSSLCFFLLIVLCFSSALFVLKVRMSPLFIKGYMTWLDIHLCILLHSKVWLCDIGRYIGQDSLLLKVTVLQRSPFLMESENSRISYTLKRANRMILKWRDR